MHPLTPVQDNLPFMKKTLKLEHIEVRAAEQSDVLKVRVFACKCAT